jgi:peptidoglycan/LPS O-acetylase OafA/YrhL
MFARAPQSASRPKPPRQQSERPLIGLELARFVCAVAVTFWHYQHFFYVAGKYPADFSRAVQPGYAWFWPLYELGYLAVPVFWSLSGFIFFFKYGQPVAEGCVSGGKFARLRFSRLYPLHLATLLLVALLQWWFERLNGSGFVYDNQDLRHFVLQLLMASDWGLFERGSSYNGPIWSISVEVVVYTIFFVVTRRIGASIGIMVGMVCVPAVLIASHATDSYIVRCLLFFYLGGLTLRADGLLARLATRRQLALLLGALAGLALLVAALPRLRQLPPIILAIPAAPLLLLILLRTVKPRSASVVSLIAALGNTTYSSYLIHFPIQLAAALLYAQLGRDMPAGELWWLALFLLLTFGLAVPVYRWFELPAQTWLRRWFEQRTSASSGPPALVVPERRT